MGLSGCGDGTCKGPFLGQQRLNMSEEQKATVVAEAEQRRERHKVKLERPAWARACMASKVLKQSEAVISLSLRPALREVAGGATTPGWNYTKS